MTPKHPHAYADFLADGAQAAAGLIHYHAWIKVGLTALVALIAWFVDAVTNVFANDGQYIFLLAAAILMDTITGVFAASKRGEIIAGHAFRRTAIKLVMYCGAAIITIGMSNAYGFATWLGPFACFYMTFTELMSILENTGQDRLMTELVNRFRGILDGIIPGKGGSSDSDGGDA